VGRLFAGADFQLAMPFEIKKIEKLMDMSFIKQLVS
jgi:hypothetical protein